MAFRRLWFGWQAVQLARTATAALPADARAPVRAGMQVVALGVAAAACAGLAWIALLVTAVLAIVGSGWWIALAAAGVLVGVAAVCGALARARWRTARSGLVRLSPQQRPRPEGDVLDGVARPVERDPGAP